MSKVKAIKGKIAEITLGGQKHYLKYDLNSFAELEELYGDVDKAMEDAEKGKLKALRAILWAGLIHESLDANGLPTIKPHDVGAMVSMEDLRDLFTTMNETMKESIPDEAIKEEGESSKEAPLE